jgi:hypothetical protein
MNAVTDIFLPITAVVLPAKGGTHLSTVSGVDKWIPAFAGKTIYFCCSLAAFMQEGARR